MSVRDPESSQRCSAHKRLGGVCGQWAMRGQAVCFLHGGKSPQALKKAEERMRELVHPAVSSLARQIEKDEFQAVRYVLDYAGFKAVEKLESNGDTTVHVVFDDMPIVTPTRSLTNGNGTHG